MYNELEGFYIIFKNLFDFLKSFKNPTRYTFSFRVGFVLYKKKKRVYYI